MVRIFYLYLHISKHKKRMEQTKDMFLWGKHKGERISTFNDTYFLRLYFEIQYHNFKNDCQYTRKRLEELGFTFYNNAFYENDILDEIMGIDTEVLRLSKMNGHFWNNKQRLNIEAFVFERKEFEGLYGTNYLILFETTCGKIVKYLGGANLPVFTVDGVIHTIGVTIKHDYYNDKPETRIQRLKRK